MSPLRSESNWQPRGMHVSEVGCRFLQSLTLPARRCKGDTSRIAPLPTLHRLGVAARDRQAGKPDLRVAVVLRVGYHHIIESPHPERPGIGCRDSPPDV